MCTPEEVKRIVHEELAKCEEKFTQWVHEELKLLQDKAQDAIIDRNSVHQLLEQINKNLDLVLEQTPKTNGRVNGLEKWKEVHAIETNHIEKSIGVFQSYLSRLNWIVIVAVLGAVLSLIFV
jgi:hypothetical protein